MKAALREITLRSKSFGMACKMVGGWEKKGGKAKLGYCAGGGEKDDKGGGGQGGRSNRRTFNLAPFKKDRALHVKLLNNNKHTGSTSLSSQMIGSLLTNQIAGKNGVAIQLADHHQLCVAER